MAKKKKEEPAPEPVDGVEGEEGAPAKKKLAGKTLILFIVLPALLVLGAGGAAAYFLLAPQPGGEQHASAEKPKEDDKGGGKKGGGKAGEGKPGEPGTIEAGEGVAFYNMPEMVVNITTGDGRPAFLKLRLVIEAREVSTLEAIAPQLPRVLDQYQAFLRELRVEDLSGSAGAYRLRLELLRRINLAVAPATVDAVLIQEMLIN
jgi:flagellar FliL protein